MGTCLSRFCPSPLVFERTAVADNDEDNEDNDDNDDADDDTDVWSARVTKEAAGEEEEEEAADRARADGVERLLPAAGQVPRRIWV